MHYTTSLINESHVYEKKFKHYNEKKNKTTKLSRTICLTNILLTSDGEPEKVQVFPSANVYGDCASRFDTVQIYQKHNLSCKRTRFL